MIRPGRGDDDELDGFFESHEEYPPDWLCVLTVYIDETLDAPDGGCIVAGYVGRSSDWKSYQVEWKKARGKRNSLHLADMHLGSESAPRKYEDLLKRLALVPKSCKLRPFVGSICEEDYKHHEMVAGTVLETIMVGYALAILALMDRIAAHLRPDERIEVVFEQRAGFSSQRERAMICWNGLPHHRTSSGKPIVSKWGEVEKCIWTEASDYLCYALRQRAIDRNSQKAILTSPILEAQRYSRNHQGKEVVEQWLREIAKSRTRPILKSTAENKRAIRRGL